MAYNQFFPQGYGVYNPYQQNYNQAPQQIQNGGFISVRSMEEALNYPVAPGNSVTFKDENAPYVYTKTKGFSQLDQPIFEKYRLVKEAEPVPEAPQKPDNGFDCEKEIKLLWDEVKAVKNQLKAHSEFHRNEVESDDAE